MKTLNIQERARLNQLRSMAAKYSAAWKKYATHSKRGGGSSATLEQQAKIRQACGFDFSNDERAELETLEFVHNPRPNYFAYLSPGGANVTGFMGNTLARITHYGQKFKGNFGDERQTFRAEGINGIYYVGTIYGSYLRMRRAIDQPNERSDNPTVRALQLAEDFIRGFEGDEMQKGIRSMLRQVRQAIAREQIRDDVVNAARNVCSSWATPELAEQVRALDCALLTLDSLKN